MPLSRRALIGAGALAPLAACAPSATWRPVMLDAEPSALASMAGGLLVGTRGPALLAPSGPVPVTATTGYGREGRWVALDTADMRIVGVCGTRGGAHGNSRWTVFAGDATAVRQQDQAFEVFHGYGAGTLVGAVFAGAEPVLVGSWQSAAAGYDVALWLRQGDRWVRQRSTGALASTDRALLSVHAASGGDRLMLAGQVIQLSPQRTAPVAWTSADPRRGWARLDLPTDAPVASAQSVAAHPDGWLVTGRAGSTLVAWTISRELAVSSVPLPEVPGAGGTQAAAAADGTLLIAAGDGSVSTVLTGRPGGWQRSTVPAGQPVAAGMGARPQLVAATGQGPAQLFELS